MREFDYYIFIDYSEDYLGYLIIDKEKVNEILPKISKFKHYRKARNRKLYLNNASKTLRRENIYASFLKFDLCKNNEKLKVYTEVLDFVIKFSNWNIFISIDDHEYSNFTQIFNPINSAKIILKKESELREKTCKYQMNLVLDTILNLKRLKNTG